ncbi:hypothetical protein H4217_002887 [Coemansia sp. RSA 1939]|nr:hypothetical protein H4217_002887 [Coemansia sp. RSA 1939]
MDVADPYQAARSAGQHGNRPVSGYSESPYSQNQKHASSARPPQHHQGYPGPNRGTGIAPKNPTMDQSSSSASQAQKVRGDINSHHPGRRDRRVTDIGEFRIIKTLGKGTFSKVFMAEHHVTKRKYALKFIKSRPPQGGNAEKHNIRVEREIKLLSILWHPNIVRLYDVSLTPKYTMIVMDYNSGGELLQLVRKRGRLHENEARGFFRQIVSAIDYIHRNCVIHRDLKLENVMLDHENRVHIIDFGFANSFEWDKQLDTFCGSPFYAAPEMVNGIKYTGPEVDIWSMGIILFFLLCGRTPFEGEKLNEIYAKISRGKFSLQPYLSKDSQNLLQQMLMVNPKLRITMKGIIDHPWTNKDYDHPVDNHLPPRPSVVVHPNEQSLQKMRSYEYDIDAVVAALTQGDMAMTPMVCIYHLIEEKRRRKAARNARRSQATNLGGTASTKPSVDPVPIMNPPQPQSGGVPPTTPVDYARPTSRGRHSYAPSYTSTENYSPTNRLGTAPLASDSRQKGPSAASNSHQPPHSHTGANLHAPQPPYLVNKGSDLSNHGESLSFGASQYEPPRLRKGSTASGQLSVASSINLEESSPYLRDNDKRNSRSSRFFERVRKSMPFLKGRQSQVMEDMPRFDQSHNQVGSGNRVSFFQAPFRRFSAAPSAMSLNSVHGGNHIQSYYPPHMPPPPPQPQFQQQMHQQQQQHQHQQQQQQVLMQQQHPNALPVAAYQQRNQVSSPTRPSTANNEPRLAMTPNQRPATSGGQRHRYTDFGPTQNAPLHPDSGYGGGRHRKSEPPQDLPYEPSSNSENEVEQRRTPRPLSVVSGRQVTPLRLHPSQSHQNNQTAVPFTQQKAGVQLPPALASRGSAPTGVGNSQQQPGGKSGVRGIFNLRCTMLGPLDEIQNKIEHVLKSKAIILRKMNDVVYSCEDQGLRFEIIVETVQGHLHTIKFKRLEGNWWAYKKLTVAISNELQSVEYAGM